MSDTAPKASEAEGIDVAYVAGLARLRLTAEEEALFQEQLAVVVGYVQKVAELDLSEVEPTAHGIPVQNVFRRDTSQESLPRDVVMANAPRQQNGQFMVPKIVE